MNCETLIGHRAVAFSPHTQHAATGFYPRTAQTRPAWSPPREAGTHLNLMTPVRHLLRLTLLLFELLPQRLESGHRLIERVDLRLHLASFLWWSFVGQQLSALPFIDACTMTLSRLTIFHSPSPWSTRANMTQTCRQRWPSTRGQLHPDRLCDDPWLLHLPFFLVALTATLLPLQPVGPDGLRIMIGASARQEPGFRGHPLGSWRKPRVPSHCYDDAAQFREAVFSGASPVRVR